jgi:iron complex outermembrane recepter protein
MLKKTPLASAIGSISLASALAATGVAMPAFAADDAIIDEVVVTGTRIKRADLESASPVTVITRQEMENKGFTDVGQLLQRMPSMSGSPIGTTTNNGGDGSVQVDLRGLGVVRTLTLVDGKRTVDGGDYQTIPATMIERVEILKDGASAVYGADAVAGVVNIITRRDYEGFKVEAFTTDYLDMKSGKQDSYNFIAGKSFDGGNFMFGGEYVKQEEAYQSDAPWDFFQNSYYIYPGGCEAQVTAPYDGTPTGGCYVAGSSRIPESRLNSAELVQRLNADGTPRLYDPINDALNGTDDYLAANGVPTFNNANTFMNTGDGNGLVDYDGRVYNYAPVNYIQTPYERTNLFAHVNYSLTEDINLTAAMRFNKRQSAQELAPQPYNSPTDPAYNGTYIPLDPITGLALREVDAVDAAGDPISIYTADQTLGSVVDPVAYSGIAPDNFYNTTGFAIRDARRRMVETTRSFVQDVDQLQVVFGLDGEFNDVTWDIYFNKGWRDRTDVDYGQFFGVNLANAMGPSADLDANGTPECYGDINDTSTLIKGCVPMNFFGGPGSLTQDMIDYVAVDLVDTFEQETEQYGFSLTGSGYELPAGALGWAVGFEHREESYVYSADSAKVKGAVTGNKGAGTTGGYRSNSVFGEVLLPVFDNGEQSFTMTAGVRWDDFSTFGDDTTYQIGLEANVTQELKLRATFGEVFRAPNIGESFAGVVDGFPTYKDPCVPAAGAALPAGCAQVGLQLDSQVLARVGGNPNLTAEFGDTVTAGLVYTPELAFGSASITLDYWKTELEDLISTLGVNYILDDCYNKSNANSCALITRRADYSIAQISDAPLNVAKATAEGIDTEVRVSFDTEYGQIDASVLWSHMLERTQQAFEGDEINDIAGTFTGSAFAEDKIGYSVDWSRGDFHVAYLGEMIGEMTAEDTFGIGYLQTIDSQLYHDIILGYSYKDTGLSATLGLTNITDEAPPFIDLGFNASTDPSTYRLFGRGYYVRLSWEMGE